MAVAGTPAPGLDLEEEEREEEMEEEVFEEEVEEGDRSAEAGPREEANTPAAVDGAAAVVAGADTENKDVAATMAEGKQRWAGWPGDSVFRLVVPALKIGSIIGKKGETIKNIEEETRARIRVLDAALGSSDQIVLISAKEELEVEVSPAMDAALRVFKRVHDVPDNCTVASVATVCTIRLLIPSSQAVHVIGKHGSTVKSVQENSGATIRVLQRDALAVYAKEDERVVEIQGEYTKAYNALKSVTALLRKFLVDHGVIPLFEKRTTGVSQEPAQSIGDMNNFSIIKPDSLISSREAPLDPKISSSRLLLYGRDPAVPVAYPPIVARLTDFVTQITQTMQIPFPLAEEIIGVGGGNISYIRRRSGAMISLSESRAQPDEIVVEIKGTITQVQKAQQLIQDTLSHDKEPTVPSYGELESSAYSRYASNYSIAASSTYLSTYHRDRRIYGSSSSVYEPSYSPYARDLPYRGYRGGL